MNGVLRRMRELSSTQGLSPAEQLEFFQNLISDGFCNCDANAEKVNGECRAELETIKLGQIDVLKYQGAGVQKAHRRMSHIRKDPTEDLLIYLPLTAVVEMEHSGNVSRFLPGQFAFVNTAYPFSGSIYAENYESYSALLIKIPSALFRHNLPVIDRYRNQPFPIERGCGRIMMSFLDTLIEEAHLLKSAETGHLGESLLNVIVSAAHHAIYGNNKTNLHKSVSMKEAAYKKIMAFMEANLSNPELHTSYIASQCGISVRYLHSLFEDSPYTVSSWIREQRLLKCREVLRNPEAADLSIIEIALAWGFNDASHFTRLYKSRFGISPSRDRITN